MKRSLTFVAAFFLLAGSPATTLADDELDGTVKISGSAVVVQVRHKDGQPAAGVQVRLIYARQFTTAAARTDDQGRWVTAVAKPGP